jgi:transcriptional regulator with XRE-family HTH domain
MARAACVMGLRHAMVGIMDLPQRIREAREAAGLSREKLGELLGYQPDPHGGCPTLSRWESGKRTPTLPQLARLATTLGRAIEFTVDGARCRISPEIPEVRRRFIDHDVDVMVEPDTRNETRKSRKAGREKTTP